jgi:4-hydroxy-tetrahydrodipicolinate reductase
MGRQLVQLLPGVPELALHAACASAHSAQLGADSGRLAGGADNGVPVTGDLSVALRAAQLLIDFSNAVSSVAHIDAARAARVPLLLGTTGWQADTEAALQRAAHDIPVLQAANTSVGVALLADLVKRAAAALGAEFNIEIVETHHRMKLDAPSGTALLLGQAAAAGRDATLAALRTPADRNGLERRAEQIGIASVRGGDVVGEHEVHFLGQGERLVLRHSATDRALFARGALRAGRWLADQSPGRYHMADYLALKS